METKMEILDKSYSQQVAAWPPVYSVRYSRKAKQVILMISESKGLEIVVPIRDKYLINIKSLLSNKRSWIEKQLKKFSTVHLKAKLTGWHTIRAFDFPCFYQKWNVLYDQNRKRTKVIEDKVDNMDNYWLLVPYKDSAAAKATLIKWIKDRAKQYLSDKIYELSQEYQLTYTRVTVRSQKNLWGSCNNLKRINLNYKLIFLPEHLIRYVLLHELCHTVYLNHSKYFWRLLEQCEPRAREYDRQINLAWKYIPIGLK